MDERRFLGGAGFDEVRRFTYDAASLLVARNPEALSVDVRRGRRSGRVYIDVLRNGSAGSGVSISNRAEATYTDADGTGFATVSPTVTVTVLTVAAVTVTPDETEPSATVAPNERVTRVFIFLLLIALRTGFEQLFEGGVLRERHTTGGE